MASQNRGANRFLSTGDSNFTTKRPTDRVMVDWLHACKTEFDPDEDLDSLEKESKKPQHKEMRVALQIAKALGKPIVKDLTHAECLAVTMYTIEDGGFYKKFNTDCRSGAWYKHQFYCNLLLSACAKLSKSFGKEDLLYRGQKSAGNQFPTGSFCFPCFTSTSRNLDKIQDFISEGDHNLIMIYKSCQFGAKISKLSALPEEDEVLIIPFEEFRVVRSECHQNKNYITEGIYEVKSCDDQSLLGQSSDESSDGD